MNNPYARAARSIPVTVVSNPVAGTTTHGTVIVRMEPSRHDHASGIECVACAAQTDIRAVLFDLLESARQGSRPPFSRVIVDASALHDPTVIADRLIPGKLPALGLRDHTVARSFHLEAAQ